MSGGAFSVVSSPMGSGAEPQSKRCLGILYAFFCDFRRVLVHFGGRLSGKLTPKIQKNITGVGKVDHVACLHLDKASVASK